MLRRHPAFEAIKDITSTKPKAAAAVLDDAKNKAEIEAKAAADALAAKAVLDAASAPVLDEAGAYQDSDIALKAVAAVQEWAETTATELDEGEGVGDRLFSLLAGIADADMDGEISEAEADIMNQAANVAADYLISKGAPESDVVSLLEDFDNDLAESLQELVLSALPDGDSAAAEEIDMFVFGDGSDEAAMDSVGAHRVVDASGDIGINFNGVVLDSVTFGTMMKAPDWMQMTDAKIREFAQKAGAEAKVFDATYKKKIVVRRGKKVRINKRVSGTVRLNAKQKMAVKKMLRKSHSAVAQMRRAKSVKVRKRSGL